MGMTREMAQILIDCRAQALLAAKMEEALRETRAAADGVRSAGAERIGGASGGPAVSTQQRYAERIEQLTADIKCERKRCQKCAERARAVIAGMNGMRGRFAMLFYLQGFTLEEICRIMDRNERSVRRWRAEIEQLARGSS